MADETPVAPAAESGAPATETPADDKGIVDLDKPEPDKPTSETPLKTEAKADGDEADDEHDGDKAKRLSRSQRQGRKLALLAAENAELRRIAEQVHRPSDARPAATAADDEKPPKEADFNGDYLAFERALNAFNTTKAVNDAVRRQVDQARTLDAQQRQAEARQEAIVAHMDRVDEARERIPDFDKVIKAGGHAQVAPQVAAELLDSEKSALLQYFLANNPDKLKELNGMSGRELAREIGRLEGRVHLPKAKSATEASPPLSAVTGGAANQVDLRNADMETYVRERRKQINAAKAS